MIHNMVFSILAAGFFLGFAVFTGVSIWSANDRPMAVVFAAGLGFIGVLFFLGALNTP